MRDLVVVVLWLLVLVSWGEGKSADVEVRVVGEAAIATTDEHFVCATIDWGPPEHCDPADTRCLAAHPQTSVLNLDLHNPLLAKVVKAFDRLRIRIGGSLQDQVIYDVGELQSPCLPFKRDKSGLFGYTEGCLRMDRWDELNKFFNQTRAIVTFGLNALYGRKKGVNEVWTGDWNPNNSHSFIDYTVKKGFQIDSWEFGNELSGKGIGASVPSGQYAKDLIKLRSLINEIYDSNSLHPLLLAPGGFYDEHWFSQLLQDSRPGVFNVLTHHIYNLGAPDDPNLIEKVLDPGYLSHVAGTFRSLHSIIQKFGPWTTAWVGEAGGVFRGGAPDFSDTYADSFWYLDQLGMSARYDTKVYCRQKLIGSNYSLLNVETMVPYPDYYSALLWHQLMGRRVLFTNVTGSAYLRAYAHCSKDNAGITMLLINLSNDTEFRIMLQTDANITAPPSENIIIKKKGTFMHGLKKVVAWMGKMAPNPKVRRREYHLTPRHGKLRSQSMLLNGELLELTLDGDIPSLSPAFVGANSSISVMPLSIAFVNFPHIDALACSPDKAART
ncbi:heparanase-like protein 2 [Nymphaea colorata]|nr:heparanase-like protein 2 [Nymphaea colorata]